MWIVVIVFRGKDTAQLQCPRIQGPPPPLVLQKRKKEKKPDHSTTRGYRGYIKNSLSLLINKKKTRKQKQNAWVGEVARTMGDPASRGSHQQ